MWQWQKHKKSNMQIGGVPSNTHTLVSGAYMSADTAGGRRLESVLQKKGHSRKNWKTRTVTWEPETKTAVYFIVAKSKQIPEGVRKEKGRLVIESVVDIPDRNKKRLFRFNLVGGGAALELCAASQQEKEAWLRTVAEDTDEVKKVLGQREQQYATEMEAKKRVGGRNADSRRVGRRRAGRQRAWCVCMWLSLGLAGPLGLPDRRREQAATGRQAAG